MEIYTPWTRLVKRVLYKESYIGTQTLPYEPPEVSPRFVIPRERTLRLKDLILSLPEGAPLIPLPEIVKGRPFIARLSERT